MSWDELVASALVGTARRAPALPDLTGPVGDVLAKIDRADPEGAVLEAGAVIGMYRQAGWRPPADAAAPLPPSPPERRHLCSEVAAGRLDAMLEGRYRVVLAEWLELVAAGGRLVPPERLPRLLDAATTSASVRPAAAAVIGERGRWLAGLNPSWSWAGGGTGEGEAADAIWATGSPSARRLLLGRMRRADPAGARELLASTWATEVPDDRAAFLMLLGTGLSMDDEPFLEAALNDRRKEVRQVAAGLLWRLPESRLASRMAARARPLLRVTAGRIEVKPPGAVDAGMARDGIGTRPPAGEGQRAWWLRQLVAATPLRTWPEALRRHPCELVQLADPALRRAWATAAARQGDETWASALLEVDEVHEPELLGAIASDRAAAVATDRVARLGLTPAVLELLDHAPRPWLPALSTAVVERLGTAVKRPRRDANAAALRAKLTDLAVGVDPSVLPQATAALAEHGGWWADVVGWFLDLLTFRSEMREELSL